MGRINAGDLTERVALHYPGVATPDGRGGQRPGPPTDPVVVWARKRELSGMEKLRLGQTLASSVVEFTLRFRAGVVTTTRLVWQGRTYAIRQVSHDDRNEFTTLTCEDNGRN